MGCIIVWGGSVLPLSWTHRTSWAVVIPTRHKIKCKHAAESSELSYSSQFRFRHGTPCVTISMCWDAQSLRVVRGYYISISKAWIMWFIYLFFWWASLLNLIYCKFQNQPVCFLRLNQIRSAERAFRATSSVLYHKWNSVSLNMSHRRCFDSSVSS